MANSHGSSHGNFPVGKLTFRGNGNGNGKKRLPTVNLNFHGKNCLAPANCLDGFTGQLGQAVGQAVCRASLAVMRCLVGHAMRSASPLRAGLASGGRSGGQKPQLGGCSGLGGPGPLAVGRGTWRRAGQDLTLGAVGSVFQWPCRWFGSVFPWLGVVFQWLSTVVAQGVGQGVGHAVGRTVRRNWLLGSVGRVRAPCCWARCLASGAMAVDRARC